MRRNVLAAGAALALVAGFAAVSSEDSAAHNATGLQMRLASATRVAHEHRGTGYWLVSSTGAVSHFGSAKFYGSMAGRHLKAPIIGIVATADDRGYWLVAKDGGVFAFNAPYLGSMGGTPLNAPIVGIAAAPTSDGYYLVASDGGVFAFGTGAHFQGSAGSLHLVKPIVGMALG